MRHIGFISAGLLVAAGFAPFASRGAEPPPALFTADQPAAGEALYLQRCSGCHNANLTDGGQGPGLITDGFWSNWEQKSARTLYGRILSTMPSNEPGSLLPGEALLLTAFILKSNGYPAGEQTLETADTLNPVRLHRQK